MSKTENLAQHLEKLHTDLCHPMDQIPPLLAFGTFAAAAHLSHSGQTHTEPRWIVHHLLPPMGILQPKQPA